MLQRPIRIDKIDLMRPHEPKELLAGIAAQNMAGLLQNLNEISVYAAEIFGNLMNQTKNISDRLIKIQGRADSLSRKASPSVMEAESSKGVGWIHPSEVFLDVKFRSNLFTPETRTKAVKRRYDKAKRMPPLSLLDQYSKGSKCSDGYSNPQQFKEWWLKEVEKDLEDRKKRRKQRKARKKAELEGDIKTNTISSYQRMEVKKDAKVDIRPGNLETQASVSSIKAEEREPPAIADIDIAVSPTHQSTTPAGAAATAAAAMIKTSPRQPTIKPPRDSEIPPPLPNETPMDVPPTPPGVPPPPRHAGCPTPSSPGDPTPTCNGRFGGRRAAPASHGKHPCPAELAFGHSASTDHREHPPASRRWSCDVRVSGQADSAG